MNTLLQSFRKNRSLWTTLIVLLVLFIYRRELVDRRHRSKGIVQVFYRLLTFDSTNLSPEAIALDRSIIKWLATAVSTGRSTQT